MYGSGVHVNAALHAPPCRTADLRIDGACALILTGNCIPNCDLTIATGSFARFSYCRHVFAHLTTQCQSTIEVIELSGYVHGVEHQDGCFGNGAFVVNGIHSEWLAAEPNP